MLQLVKPTYLKLMPNGCYEYGVIEYGKDRRKDRLVKVGEAPTYETAAQLIRDLAEE